VPDLLRGQAVRQGLAPGEDEFMVAQQLMEGGLI
jgi:hypothetical protein